MIGDYINEKLYHAIINFDEDDAAREYYYQIMDTETGKITASGHAETVRDKILTAYAFLFCEESDTMPGTPASVDDVADTADRLYIGSMGYDPKHWYRMRHHFPVIDDDNYDRFAALVISDIKAGPLRQAAINDGEMLVVGERDPLRMTAEERKNQKVRKISAFSEDEML